MNGASARASGMEIPDPLLNAFHAIGGRGVVAFVGSGPSCDAGVPSWPELIRRVALELKLENEIATYLGDSRFVEAAEFLRKERSEDEIQGRIANEIRKIDHPGELHRLIVNAPFSAIVTTNYDLLLSGADTNRFFDPPITHQSIAVRDHLHRPFIFHLHGNINEPPSIVLTRKGYDEILAPKSVPARQFIYNILGTYVVLFIGFGFRDIDVDELLRQGDEIRALGYATVYALIPLPAGGDRVMDQNLRSRRVNPIYVEQRGDHGVAALRDWLAYVSRSVSVIAHSRALSTRAQKSRQVVATVAEILSSNLARPCLQDALALLPHRPDIANTLRRGLNNADMSALIDELSVFEMRRLLIALNRSERNPYIEDILTCFLPEQ